MSAHVTHAPARDVALTGSRHVNPNRALTPERLACLSRRLHRLGLAGGRKR
jgi:hypothetical protein